MLYLGIDQHARQITISLRDENGDVLQARQVSTQPEKVHAFFQRLTRERLHADESLDAVPVGVLESVGHIRDHGRGPVEAIRGGGRRRSAKRRGLSSWVRA